jgi:hypothetical protein
MWAVRQVDQFPPGCTVAIGWRRSLGEPAHGEHDEEGQVTSREETAMEWLLVGLVVGGGGLLARRVQQARTARAEEREDLAAVRSIADEDVTVFGEQLARLDREVAGHDLDEPTRVDYQSALDAYESAQRSVPRIRRADEISKVTDALSSGRYALACVQARVHGQALPQLRVPCFFNPQHGPAERHVEWIPRGRGMRRVPACAVDAARVAAHEEPEVRKVRIGSRVLPYWEAGTAFQPYTEGYFSSAVALSWAFAPWTEFQHTGFDSGGMSMDGGGPGDGGGFGDGGGGGDGGGN